METTCHRLLDSQFLLHSEFGDAWFFDRIARAYGELAQARPAPGGALPTGALPTDNLPTDTLPNDPQPTSSVEIQVHHACEADLRDASADWTHQGHFHRSLNYPHWDLHGPAEPGAIHLQADGMLFRHHAALARLDVHVDPMRARRASELIFHAARNLALWRRGPRFAPMLHASAVVFDGAAWLFLGGKGAGKSTLFVEAVLRHGARPLANDRVLLDAEDGRSVWSWPSYLSYCEGTIVDYPELRRVFDAGLRDQHRRREGRPPTCELALYRRSYLQEHKRIVAPCLFAEVLGLRYLRRAPLAGVVRAALVPGHPGGATLHRCRSTARLQADDIEDAVFSARDPDFPCWHGDEQARAACPDPARSALAWLQAADLPCLDLTIDPVCGKQGLRQLLDR